VARSARTSSSSPSGVSSAGFTLTLIFLAAISDRLQIGEALAPLRQDKLCAELER